MTSKFKDKTLVCAEDGAEFVWTADEQQFYAEKGYENAPKRCPEHRAKRKHQNSNNRESYEIICSNCGNKDTVPFKPVEGRQVLCRNCFAESRKP